MSAKEKMNDYNKLVIDYKYVPKSSIDTQNAIKGLTESNPEDEEIYKIKYYSARSISPAPERESSMPWTDSDYDQ